MKKKKGKKTHCGYSGRSFQPVSVRIVENGYRKRWTCKSERGQIEHNLKTRVVRYVRFDQQYPKEFYPENGTRNAIRGSWWVVGEFMTLCSGNILRIRLVQSGEESCGPYVSYEQDIESLCYERQRGISLTITRDTCVSNTHSSWWVISVSVKQAEQFQSLNDTAEIRIWRHFHWAAFVAYGRVTQYEESW